MKKLILSLSACIAAASAHAQFSVHKGDQVMQFSGLITAYYNHRFYDVAETNHKKDQFGLKDAQLDLRAWVSNKIEFKLKTDIADIVSNGAAGGTSGLLEATATFIPFIKGPEIKAGFDKPPFARFAMVQAWDSPFYDRPEMDEGEFYPHREIGVTIQQGFKADRIIAYGGVYNGNGDAALAVNNDQSGNAEYIGRIEFNWPTKLRYNFMPLRHDPKPIVSVAANVRYDNKQTFSTDTYQLTTVDGKKLLYGIDGAAQWKHVQVAAEILQAHIIPNDTLLVAGSGDNYYRAGGYAMQASWYEPRTGVMLATRYDWFNPNDLKKDDIRRSLNLVADWHIKGTQAWVKTQYMHRLPVEGTDVTWKDDDVRIGVQLMF